MHQDMTCCGEPKGSEGAIHVDGEEEFRLRNSVDGDMPYNIVHFMEVTKWVEQRKDRSRDQKAVRGSRMGSGKACKHLHMDDLDYAA